MKFMLVGPTYPFRGGIAHHTTRLYHALKARHAVDFVTFRRQYPRWLFPGRTDRDPSAAPAETIAVAMLDPLNPLTWWHTASHIRKDPPDALILPWWVSYWAPSFAIIAYRVRRAGTRVIFICHNVLPHEPRPGEWMLSWVALGQGDGFVIQSREDGARVSQLAPRTHIKYVPHPIYSQSSAANVPRDLRAGKLPRLLFFGFVRSYKGLQVLLEAMPLILEQKPVRLTVAGEFWDKRERYERQICDLKIQQSVSLLDRYVSDEELSMLFAQVDLVVLPYLSATASGALGMAVGHGVPVVVSDVGDLGQIVNDHAIGGVAVHGDKHSLAQTVLNCLEPEQLARYRRNVAQMQAGAESSWQRLVDAIEMLATE